MTSKVMAFGTRNNAMFVIAPQKALAMSRKGVVGDRELTNGQLTKTRSKLDRKHYDFIFKGSDVDLEGIRDFIDNRYSRGPFMVNTPRALNGNMLPRSWSQPALAVSERGNAAMDFYSNAIVFGAPLSTSLNNPNEQPVTLTGLTNAPLTGMCIWCGSATAPVVPVTNVTRPFHSILVPPNYAPRITVWGVKNSATSPVLYYSLSAIPAATVAAGTAIVPVAGGATATPATSGSWRVLDLWIGSGVGSSLALTEYTTFGAMDVRMALTTAPAQPTVFNYGRGQFGMKFAENLIPETIIRVGATDDKTFYEIDGSMEEVSQPW